MFQRKALVVATASALALWATAAPSFAQSAPAANAAGAPAATDATSSTDAGHDVQEIVVTGQTSKGRKLLTATSDVTVVTNQDIQDKAPRNLESLFEMVPGVYVENSAGSVDNNVEVRGLPGGSQYGVGWEIDGLGETYQALDLTVDHAEAVRGGSSTVLAVGASGVLMNIITKKPNFDEFEGEFKIGGANYGDQRADFYVTGPIADKLAFNAGGYIEANKGQRDGSETYDTFHLKGSLEYKLDNGGTVRVTARREDENDPYYADMLFQEVNGQVLPAPGLNWQSSNMVGSAFAHMQVPSTYVDNPSGLSPFNLGAHDVSDSLRLDLDLPVTDNLSFHTKSSYSKEQSDKYYVYPGGYGPALPAANFLDMKSATTGGYGGSAPWPLGPLLAAGYNHFGGAGNVTQFGIQNLRTNVVIPGSNAAALTALNGNGLLQLSVVDALLDTDDQFKTNSFFTYDAKFGNIHNSLTSGVILNRESGHQDQSAGSGTSYLTDVANNASIYNIVAMNGNNVLGAVTNNGTYQNTYWGSPAISESSRAVYGYFNDEMQIGDKLYVDFGARRDDFISHGEVGGLSYGASPNQLAAGASSWMVTGWGSGVFQPSWNGTESSTSQHYMRTPFTLGASYVLTNNYSVYGRISRGFDDSIAGPSGPLALQFEEMGVRYHNRIFNISADVFQAVVKNLGFDFTNSNLPAADQTSNLQGASESGNVTTPGVEFDADFRPVKYFGITAQSTFQRPHVTDTLVVAQYSVNGTITNVPIPGLDPLEGNVPERTPKVIYSVKPAYYFPDNKGSLFAIYHYNGRTFADPGNNLPLAACGRTELGMNYNITPKINFTATMENAFNTFCLTEGNPRQGVNEQIINGYFYGRSIMGRNANAYLLFKF